MQEENKAGRRAGIWGRAPGRAREGGVGGVVRRSGEDQIPRRENSMCKGPGAKVSKALGKIYKIFSVVRLENEMRFPLP